MSKFIAVEEAISHILSRIPVTSGERIHLGKSQGRCLLRAIDAPFNSPRFDNSAMDGFAVRWDDIDPVPSTLAIRGVSAAGHPSAEVVVAGQAFQISTGAPIPSGADTVVPRELCEVDGEEVTINELPGSDRGANIRLAGTYLQAGEPALQPGRALTGADVGLLVSFNRPVIEVHRQPRVAIISTGDELVELGDEVGPGQIINSNAYMLESLVARFGGIPIVYPIVPDDRDATVDTFQEAVASADLVISSGGVSVGDHDHVRDVLDEISGGMTFWKVRMKPGKPLAFGIARSDQRRVPLIGLPGNPASSFVGFHHFVRPALAVAQGTSIDDAPLARITATLRGEVSGSRGRRVYTAGRALPGDDGLIFEAISNQSSGNPALFAGANAFGIVEEGQTGLSDGAPISVHLL